MSCIFCSSVPLWLPSSVFSSVAQLCPTLCDPMNRSTPGLPVHHQLSEFTQTRVHRVGDAIQPSQPLLSPSPPARNPFQNQGLLSQLLASGGQSIGASASASVLPMNSQDSVPLGLTGLILQAKGLSRVSSNTTVHKHPILQHSVFFMVQLSHPYINPGKTIALTRWTFVGNMMSLLFNMLSRSVIAFLPRSKCLLISWLQSPSCSDFGIQKSKV